MRGDFICVPGESVRMLGFSQDADNSPERQPSEDSSPDRQVSASSTTSSSLRRVHFQGCAEVISDFVPYGSIYGVHPKHFDFDAHGRMVQPRSRSSRWSSSEMDHLLNVDLGYLLECSSPDGVAYSSRPNSQEQSEQLQALEEGDSVEVLERKGNWIRDSAGWLPLVDGQSPLFSIQYH